MEPIRKVRLSEGVVNAIKQMIVDRGFMPGDKFCSENELASELQVSRSSVREAVRILEVTGLLSVKHGKGIFIVDTEARPYEAFAEWLKNNDQSLQEHFEVRLIIEPQTARLAALCATPEEVDQLGEIHAALEHSAGLALTAEAIRHDREFHKLLGKATHNRMLFALTRSMTASLLDDWISSLHTPGRLERTVDEHGLILKAVRAGESDAAMEAMTAHLRNAIQDIQGSIRP